MKKSLIIFDVDGTLCDSELDVFLSFNHTLKENEGFELTKEEFKELAGLPLEEMFDKVLPEDKKYLADQYTKKYRKYYIDEGHFIDETVLFSNVRETIGYFDSLGFLMAIASSKPNRVLEKIIKHFELSGFDLVIGTGESNFKHKPDPETILYIMDKLDVAKEDAVMIGDSTADILAGQNAGINTIAVTYGYDKPENLVLLNPTYIINDFSELKEIIEYKQVLVASRADSSN